MNNKNKKRIKSALIFGFGVIASIAAYHQLVVKNLDKLPEFMKKTNDFVQGK